MRVCGFWFLAPLPQFKSNLFGIEDASGLAGGSVAREHVGVHVSWRKEPQVPVGNFLLQAGDESLESMFRGGVARGMRVGCVFGDGAADEDDLRFLFSDGVQEFRGKQEARFEGPHMVFPLAVGVRAIGSAAGDVEDRGFGGEVFFDVVDGGVLVFVFREVGFFGLGGFEGEFA